MIREDPFKNIGQPKSKAVKRFYEIEFNDVNPEQAETLIINCPYCGLECTYSLKPTDVPHWTIIKGAKLGDGFTVMPALRHDRANGGCGITGWLTNGKFTLDLNNVNGSPKEISNTIRATLIKKE